MSYIGNQVTSVPFTVDLFSGTVGQTLFGPMTFSPATHASVMVFIDGVYKIPVVDYTVSGNYITFNSAPASGTNNIVVHHLGNGVMATQVPADGTVISSKIGALQVQGNQIGISAVSGNNIGTLSVSGNQIGISAVSGNNIGTLSVSGNSLGLSAVSGNNIGINSINASNSITALSITGNLIGTGSISANNFAGGGITSNVLSSNLAISTVRVAETVNVVTTPVGGNYNIHVANSTVYYFTANATANITFNFVANDGPSTGTTGSLNDLIRIGQTSSIAIVVKQGSTRYRANVFIDSARANGIYWLGNSQPLFQLPPNQQSVDTYNFTIIKVAESPAVYTVLASNSTFGHANGQGMGATNGSVY